MLAKNIGLESGHKKQGNDRLMICLMILPMVWCTLSSTALACGLHPDLYTIDLNSAINSLVVSTITLGGKGYQLAKLILLDWLLGLCGWRVLL